MSLTWRNRVWASPEPSHSTDRLMLLALAEYADDEGICWPGVATLQRRCSLKTLRGARKVLERLDAAGFIERIERPGRSNLYRLSGERLETPERGDRGRAEYTDRGNGTLGPGREEHQDREPRNAGTSRTNIEPSIEPTTNHAAPARVVVGDQESLVDLLTARGVHPPIAQRLVEGFDAERIRLQVRHFDYLRSVGEAPRSSGWLAVAIRKNYLLPLVLQERLRKTKPPRSVAVGGGSSDRSATPSRRASIETVQAAVASAMEQIEQHAQEQASPKQGRKPRRPSWAQEPVSSQVLEEIEEKHEQRDGETARGERSHTQTE